MLNRCEFIGNITKDIELKTTPNGTEVVNFDIAVNKKRTDNDGNKQEKVEFISFVAFKGKANTIAQYAKKGDKIYLSGEMQTRTWEASDGTKRYKVEIYVENIELLGGSGGNTNTNNEEEKPNTWAKKPEPKRNAEEELDILDIPF